MSMTRKEILANLKYIFCDVFDGDIQLNESTTTEEIDGWDSLMHVMLLSAVENEFHIKFNSKDVIDIKTVGEMVDLIEKSVH